MAKQKYAALAWRRVLTATTALTVLAAIYMVVLWVPGDAKLGVVQKIFYFHVASAWVGFFAFFVVFVLSILYLKKKDRSLDRIAYASAEAGVVFTTIVIATGPIWAKSSWNIWWNWDIRLTTTLVLWFLYLAYLMIRSMSLEEEKRGTLSAVFGIVGFLNVPLVFMSIRWWGSIHPAVVDATGFQIGPNMLRTLLVSILAFTLLYASFMDKSVSLQIAEDRLQEMKDNLKI